MTDVDGSDGQRNAQVKGPPDPPTHPQELFIQLHQSHVAALMCGMVLVCTSSGIANSAAADRRMHHQPAQRASKQVIILIYRIRPLND